MQHVTGDGVEILIAEDSLTQAEQLKYLLEEQGYRVTVAADGKQALALVRKRKPKLIISDIVMPGGSGAELARRLQGERPAMRVLLMSGYAGESLGEDAEIPASVPFIQKPFTGDSLARKVGEVLDQA